MRVFALKSGIQLNQSLFLNVGTGLDISIKELAELAAFACDYKGKIQWDNLSQMEHQRNSLM